MSHLLSLSSIHGGKRKRSECESDDVDGARAAAGGIPIYPENPSKIRKDPVFNTSGTSSRNHSQEAQLIQCSLCNVPGFHYLIELWSHQIEIHFKFMDKRGDLTLHCPECRLGYLRFHNFMKESAIKKRKGVYLLKDEALKRIDLHYRNFHPDKLDDEDDKLAPCLICNIKFKKQPELLKHYIKHFSLHMILVDRRQQNINAVEGQTIPFVLMEILCPGSTPAPSLVLEERKDATDGSGTKSRHPKYYKCRSCPQSFDELLILWAHYYKAHTFIGPYTCDFCELSFHSSQMTSFVSHLEDHFPQKRQITGLTNLYSCGICAKTFPNVDIRNRHKSLYKELALAKRDSEKYKEILSALLSPTGIRSTEEPLVNLESEMVKLYPEALGYFPCPHCGIHFSINFHLWTHIHDYHSIIDQPYQCGYCNLGFREDQIEEYQQHVKKHEENGDKYICCYCNMTTKNMLTKLRHGQLHQDFGNISPGSPEFKEVLENIIAKKKAPEEEPSDFNFDDIPKHKLTCTKCKNVSPRPMDLWNHILTTHPVDPTRYKYCEYCCNPYNFLNSQYSNAIFHFLAIHTGDTKNRAMGCYLCDKSFESYDERAEHLILHEKLSRMSEGDEDYASVLYDILNPPNALEIPGYKEQFLERTAHRVQFRKPTGEEGANNQELNLGVHKTAIYATTVKERKLPKNACFCGICGKGFRHFAPLANHRRAVHPRTDAELASAPEPKNCPFF